MRVMDTELSIYEGLRELDWYRYLRAMWIICRDVQDIYRDRIKDSELLLIEATFDLIRVIALSEEVSPSAARRAMDLGAQWMRKIDYEVDDVFAGHWNMWMVFGMLASEIEGESEQYLASERITLALTKRFREGGPRVRFVDPAEEIDDESPMALHLRHAQRVVTGVAQVSDAVKDPAAVKDLIEQMHLGNEQG